MSDFVKQFINDKYKQIDIWKESDKSKIVLVYDELDRQVYVIKYLKNKDVPYQELKKIDKKEGSYIEKFKYLFVDEYQDINPIQEEFIKTLSGFLDMLFVVGDDDQAIYGWRGANVQNILTFEDRYEDVKVHK